MDYTQLTPEDVRSMLATIGVSSIDELFSPIPPKQRVKGLLNMPRGLSELELLADVGELESRNRSCSELTCFLGAGSYDHFIPTIVDHMMMQGTFLTGYTPYQAEASQGTLQAFYEFQTMMCRLTGMEASNASLYEQSSAAAEAVYMARGITGRSKVLVSRTVHPDTVRVIQTYLHEQGTPTAEIPRMGGVTDPSTLSALIDDHTAAVVVQSPNFFGCVEALGDLAEVAHKHGALLIVSTDPIACAMLNPPGAYGADIVVGDGQCLGIPMGYGGPVLGFLTCRNDYLRKMPGRIVGLGQDREGRRGFCLTLQTREQHIKRERATSNVCTNQGLMVIRATIYLAAMGKVGLPKVASLCHDKAHYAAERIASIPGFSVAFDAPFFKEFTVKTQKNVPQLLKACRSKNILPGVPLVRWYEELKDCFVVAVTEKRTKAEIDGLVECLEAP